MTDRRPVRWLHLSDLHLGCRGRELWSELSGIYKPFVKAFKEPP